jgi:hypothetical protein
MWRGARASTRLLEVRMLLLLRIVVWSMVALLACAWLVLFGFKYLSGSCHGLQDCAAQTLSLNNAFFLFFALGILIDGTELLIRWWRRR